MDRKPALTRIPADQQESCRRRLAEHSEMSDSGCLLWQAARDQQGYGRISVGDRVFGAHRVAWIIARGEIPNAELVIDHLCRTPACINPDHLEPVTVHENINRGARIKGDRFTCPNGHLRADHMKLDALGHQTSYCRACHGRSPRVYCRNGHDVSDGGNVVRGGKNVCIECERARTKRAAAKRRQALAYP